MPTSCSLILLLMDTDLVHSLYELQLLNGLVPVCAGPAGGWVNVGEDSLWVGIHHSFCLVPATGERLLWLLTVGNGEVRAKQAGQVTLDANFILGSRVFVVVI